MADVSNRNNRYIQKKNPRCTDNLDLLTKRFSVAEVLPLLEPQHVLLQEIAAVILRLSFSYLRSYLGQLLLSFQ